MSYTLKVMRLQPQEINAIRRVVHSFDSDAKVYLFGSRGDDTARGGDIDLLVISSTIDFRKMLRLKLGLQDELGEQQIDLITRRPDQMNEPFSAMAMETGIQL
jgi:predicted nucleotidyltransferase